MKNINKKLVQILESFSAKELSEFRKFISSPFFTKGRNYIPFLNESLKAISKKQFKPETIISKKNNKLSDQTIRNRYWELYKLAEDFIIFKDLSENTVERNKILLRNLTGKKLYSSFNLRLKETLKLLDKEKFSIKKYQDVSYFSLLNLEYLQDNNNAGHYFRESFKISKNDFSYDLLNFFEIGIEIIVNLRHKFKLDADYIQDFLKELKINKVMNRFENSDSVNEKVTVMFYYLYKAFENQDEEKFYFRSRKIFKETYHKLSDSFKISTLHHMINYCINKRNEGVFSFNYELFRLFNEKLDQDLTPELKFGHNLFNHFRSYVHVGISIKKYNWVEDFILKHSDSLPSEIRESEVKLTYAKLNFAKNKFEESLSYLDTVRTKQYQQYTDTSQLKLCAFFELRKYEDAFLEIDKLLHYMRKHNEIPENFYTYTMNFLKYYKLILKFRIKSGKSISGFQLKEIKSCSKISKKEWLLEKAEEFDL